MTDALNNFLSLPAVTALIVLTGCVQQDPGRETPDVAITQMTDLGVVNQGNALRGRDGGFSGIAGGQHIWVFGDTVLKEPNSNGDTWLSNTWSTVYDPGAFDGVSAETLNLVLGRDDSGYPNELFTYTADEEHYNSAHSGDDCQDPCGARWALWPGPVVHDPDNQRSLVFYGKIHAEPGEFNFYGVGQSIAVWDDGAERPARLTIDETAEYPTLLFGENSPSFGHAALMHDNYLLAYACDRKGDVKPCKLARVTPNKFSDLSAWEFYAGGESWSKKSSDAKALFFGNDILSINWNDHLQRFIAIYSKPLSRDIMLRSAHAPEGPWTRETRLAKALPTGNGNGWVYDAIAHPVLSTDNGQKIYITYTRETAAWQREMRLLSTILSLKL